MDPFWTNAGLADAAHCRDNRSAMDRDLIYDVGVHNGNDTAYYLHCGYRVIGIEANPSLIEALNERFAGEIADGRLTLLNVGISESDGQKEFWVCDDNTEWSSFNRDIARRNGSKHHAVAIDTVTLASVLARYGIPYYCKIDIAESDQPAWLRSIRQTFLHFARWKCIMPAPIRR